MFVLAPLITLAQKAGPKAPAKGLRPPDPQQARALYLLADGRQDSIVLRWVPSSDVLWALGNKYGYRIERFTVVRQGKLISGGNKLPLLLTPQPIRPWSHKDLEQLVDKDEYAGVVDEALYGDDFNIKMKSQSPKEIIAKMQQSQNRFGFALLVCDFSPAVAEAAGLRVVDRGVRAGERYIYRVSLALPDSLKGRVAYKPGVTMLGAGDAFMRPSVRGLKAQFGNHTVTLGWNQEMLHGLYTAFNIERAEEGGRFVRVNKHPFIQMTTSKGTGKYAYYVDSLDKNYTPYAYRVTGITPFGDTGAYSDTVRGEGLSPIDYRPLFDSLYLAPGGNTAVLRWTLPDSIRRVITGIYIAKAPKNQGPYRDINDRPFPPDQQEAIDPAVVANSNYYRIRLVEKDGSQVSSVPFYLHKADSIPPAIPTGLQGVSDAKGIARIHWKANTEKDLKGYRLFRSQVRDGEYFEITKGPTVDTAFTDTLNLGFTNPYVYYKIIALDHYYNSSDYSAPLAVRRPDTVPPMAVVFSGLSRQDTVVSLSFVSSPSKDVKSYTLYRYSREHPQKALIAVIPAGTQTVISCADAPESAELGKTLIYEIETMDSAGNKVRTRSGELFFETGFRKPVYAASATPDRSKKKIRLAWQYDQVGVERFVVYRAVGDQGRFMSCATLPGTVLAYEDTDLHISNVYRYKIKAILKNGIESGIMKEISVAY